MTPNFGYKQKGLFCRKNNQLCINSTVSKVSRMTTHFNFKLNTTFRFKFMWVSGSSTGITSYSETAPLYEENPNRNTWQQIVTANEQLIFRLTVSFYH